MPQLSTIPRTRLLDAVADSTSGTGSAWLIEAGAGFGKTVLVERLRSVLVQSVVIVRAPLGANDLGGFWSQLVDAIRRTGHQDTADAVSEVAEEPRRVLALLEKTGPFALVVEDVQNWNEAVERLLADLISTNDTEVPIVITGRRIASALHECVGLGRADLLTSTDLVLSRSEIESLLETMTVEDIELMGQFVTDLTDGWPLAVGTVAGYLRTASSSAEIVRELGKREELVNELLVRYTGELTEPERDGAGLLAVLPLFDESCAELLEVPDLLNRLAEVGVAMIRRFDGWYEFPDQVRRALMARRPANTPVPTEITEYFVSCGRAKEALSAHLAVGDLRAAAEVLAGLDVLRETLVDAETSTSVMRALGNAADEVPGCWLIHGRIKAHDGDIESAHDAFSRAARLFGETDPDLADELHIQTLLELSLFQFFSGEADGARAALERCTEAITDSSSPVLHALSLDVRAAINGADGSPDALETARHQGTAAIAAWRQVGSARDAAVSTCRLALNVLFALGRYADALQLLDDVFEVGPLSLYDRGRVAMCRALALPYLGRAKEVPTVLEETYRVADLLGRPSLAAFATMAEIRAASFLGDADLVGEKAELFITKGMSLGHPASDAEGLVGIAECVARVGREPQAREVLALLDGDEELYPWQRAYLHATVEARVGNAADAASYLDELDTDPDVEPNHRWSIDLLRALAAHRLGNAEDAKTALARAFRAVEELGVPSLPAIVESRAVAQIEAGDGEAPDSGDQARESVVEVVVIGEFCVRVDGVDMPISLGQPATLVKLLAVSDGRLHVDQIVDALWPEAEPAVGRRRLRNVMLRVREAVGPVVDRVGEEVVFAPHVTSDLSRVQRLADDALASADPNLSLLHEALRSSEGPLLAADRYEDWAERARTEWHRRRMGLFDAAARAAVDANDIDGAVDALERAHAQDPFDRTRRARAVKLLRSVGRDAAAELLSQQEEIFPEEHLV